MAGNPLLVGALVALAYSRIGGPKVRLGQLGPLVRPCDGSLVTLRAAAAALGERAPSAAFSAAPTGQPAGNNMDRVNVKLTRNPRLPLALARIQLCPSGGRRQTHDNNNCAADHQHGTNRADPSKELQQQVTSTNKRIFDAL